MAFFTWPWASNKPKNYDSFFVEAANKYKLDHNLLKANHKIKKIKEERIVDIKRILVGRKANITILEDDVIILCDDCK